MGSDANELRHRGAKQVLEDHVSLREAGRLEDDLARNYDPDVLILSGRVALRGHAGVRRAAELLGEAVDSGSYRFRALVVGDRMGLAEWSAEGEDASIRDGVDSYLIEDGQIRAQTIHYTVVSSHLSLAPLDRAPRSADPEDRIHVVRS